ncbi:hypothetical protein ABIB62_003093 [Mucilaginibacter sp. UYP25]|uniref:hypothetical protein n=1 Tax=unclassified Mucilaginibacter TaxID=2617802 RepID=UPI0033956EAB
MKRKFLLLLSAAFSFVILFTAFTAGVWGVIQITMKKGGEMYRLPITYLDKILVRGYSP